MTEDRARALVAAIGAPAATAPDASWSGRAGDYLKPVGTRFATFLAQVAGRPAIVKAEDYTVAELRPVRVHREWLGARLASRIGLAVPATRLAVHPVVGRLSVQDFVTGARRISAEELRRVATTPEGLRIMLFDVLIANHDRRPDNLLILGNAVLAIDFNVGFDFAEVPIGWSPTTLMQLWLGIDGMLAFRPDDRQRLDDEAARIEALLDENYLADTVAAIGEAFLPGSERALLLEGLLARRRTLRRWALDFWTQHIAPIHRLLET